MYSKDGPVIEEPSGFFAIGSMMVVLRSDPFISAHTTVESVDRFPSAIRRLVQHPVIALAEVHRLENIKVERVFDFAPGVPRRKLQIDDDRVFRILGIELAKCLSHDLFVLPDTRPRVAAESRRLFRDDLNLLHTRAGGHSHT